MGNIVLLDDLTINKIAAGEVIERPASVVKEMVENSIDAGATAISVEIRNGGISYIRITDNGKGIEKDDMEIAFERHATSKIRKAEDLDIVKTMGFRGEALASIAAISKVEMMSRYKDSDVGNKIIVEAGKTILQEETGCPVGTTITVQNLFFNTPVRYKFLKKDYTEAGYIEDAITRLALVNPNISFKLINSGKTIIHTSGNGDLKQVIYSIYGKDIANSILDVDYMYEDIHIKGVIGKPEIARSNRSNQLFFINGRFVKDRNLTYGAEQAFKGKMPMGKYAFIVLNLEMNPASLDVNVHPAKLEVRFKDENKIFRATYHSIKDTLEKSELEQETTKNNRKSFEERLEEINRRNATKEENSGFLGLFKKITEDPNNKPSKTLVEELYENSKKSKIQKNEEKNNEIKIDIEENNFGVFEEISKMQNKVNVSNDNPYMDNFIIKNNEEMKDETLKVENNNNLKEEKEDYKIDNIETVDKSVFEANRLRIEELLESINNSKKLREEKNNEQEINNFESVAYENIEENKSEIFDEEKEDETNIEVIDDEECKKEIEDNIVEGIEKLEVQPEIQGINEENVTIDNNDKIKEELDLENEKLDELKIEDNETEKLVIDNEEQQNLNNSQEEFESIYKEIFGTQSKEANNKKEEPNILDEIASNEYDNISVFKDSISKPLFKYIGTAFSSYIIIEIDKELYILDAIKANEKIIYEDLKENYFGEGEKDSQLLLLPDIIQMEYKDMLTALDNMEIFRKAGFELEEFGENTIKLSGAPSICCDLDTQELFLEIIKQINSIPRNQKHEIEEKFLEIMAKNIVKDRKIIWDKEKTEELMDRLYKFENPFNGIDNDSIVIRMARTDIEKKFARRK